MLGSCEEREDATSDASNSSYWDGFLVDGARRFFSFSNEAW